MRFQTNKGIFHILVVMMAFFLIIIIPVYAISTASNQTVSVTVPQSTIIKGEKLLITGTATGNPSPGVALWIMCKNYANLVTIQPDATGLFKYELESATPSTLPYVGATGPNGVCYVVSQHPGQNNQFDVYIKSSTDGFNRYSELWKLGVPVIGGMGAPSTPIRILGPGSYQGVDAEWAVTEALKDPNVDDIYAETQFLVVEPTTISPTPTITTAVTTTAIPTVSGISPISGSTLGGTVVTITGSGFNNVGVSWVKFGNTQVGITGVYNNGDSTSSVIATSPAGSAGTVDITVITTKGTTATSAATKYTYTAPTTTGATTVPTTLATTSPTTPVTTILTTATTTVPTTVATITTPITTLTTTVTTPPPPTLTTAPTDSVNKLLEEQNKKIEEQNKKLADLNKTISEQNQKLSEQNDILTQILNYFKGIFGWK